MDKSRFKGQNLLDTINSLASWGFIVVIILGIVFAGRDFIWWAFGFLGGYGLFYYLAQREIKIRKLEKHSGAEIGEGDLDEEEGKGEEFEFSFKKIFKWEDLTEYEQEKVELFIKAEEERINTRLNKPEKIITEIVKDIYYKEVEKLENKEKRN